MITCCISLFYAIVIFSIIFYPIELHKNQNSFSTGLSVHNAYHTRKKNTCKLIIILNEEKEKKNETHQKTSITKKQLRLNIRGRVKNEENAQEICRSVVKNAVANVTCACFPFTAGASWALPLLRHRISLIYFSLLLFNGGPRLLPPRWLQDSYRRCCCRTLVHSRGSPGFKTPRCV